jgi:hypothetical protein
MELSLRWKNWERPFLMAFSPETPPFSRACYPINLVRSCGSRWNKLNLSSSSPLWNIFRRSHNTRRNGTVIKSKRLLLNPSKSEQKGHLGWAPIRHCTLISTETYSEIPDEPMKRTKKEGNICRVRPVGLKNGGVVKNRRSLSYTTTIKKSCFWMCCCSLHNENALLVISNLTWLDRAFLRVPAALVEVHLVRRDQSTDAPNKQTKFAGELNYRIVKKKVAPFPHRKPQHRKNEELADVTFIFTSSLCQSPIGGTE